MGVYEEGPQCLELPFMTFIPCVGFGCGGLGFHVCRIYIRISVFYWRDLW